VTLESRVIAALGTVRDPELDTSIVELRFVSSCTVSPEGEAEIRLRLPTYFCAPNFAFLMVADAYDAVSDVEGVTEAEIVLEDHFASDTINEGVAARAGFVAAFGEEAKEELDELRAKFIRKAMLAGQDRVARPLLADGRQPAELAEMRLGDVPPSPDLDRLRERRAELGIAAEDDAPLLVDQYGAAVGVDALPLHLRRVRTTRVSIEANASQCLRLLATRYGIGSVTDPDVAERQAAHTTDRAPHTA
jgi:metal-sulfur cluster biosynthetic enzyme